MRLSLGFGVVQSEGEPIGAPLYWPVYFAVDDPAVRFLAGDVASSDWIHAPGALNKGELPAWSREVAVSGVAGPGYLGFGLLYSDGGAGDDGMQSAYEELAATLHTLALDQVARASGLGVMLGAFGSTSFDKGRDGDSPLERLREGLDPEELSKEIDQGLVTGIEAFRAVHESLLPFTPGIATASLSTASKPTATVPATRRTARRRGAAAAAAAEAGRIVAVTVQAWRVEDIAAQGAIEIRRELPTRGELKAKLTLEGRVGREDQR